MIDTSRVPLQAFDPRYRELLLRGARESFEIPCGSKTKAHRFQMMICQFRARMRKHHGEERKALWEPLYDCVVGKKPGDETTLRLYPRHDEFGDLLNAAATSAPTPLPGQSDTLLETLEQERKEPK